MRGLRLWLGACLVVAIWVVPAPNVSWATEGDFHPLGDGYCVSTYAGHPRPDPQNEWGDSVDINLDVNDLDREILAPEKGKVTIVTVDDVTNPKNGWGNSIVWESAGKSERIFIAHLSKILIVGEVGAGKPIATAGTTGTVKRWINNKKRLKVGDIINVTVEDVKDVKVGTVPDVVDGNTIAKVGMTGTVLRKKVGGKSLVILIKTSEGAHLHLNRQIKPEGQAGWVGAPVVLSGIELDAGGATNCREGPFHYQSKGSVVPETMWLGVTLNLSPRNGVAPLVVSLTASVNGNAAGSVNYTFYCDRSDVGTNITREGAVKFDGQSETTKTAMDACIYMKPGTYTAKVIVERGSARPAEARVAIVVTTRASDSPVVTTPKLVPVISTTTTAVPTTTTTAVPTTTTAVPTTTTAVPTTTTNSTCSGVFCINDVVTVYGTGGIGLRLRQCPSTSNPSCTVIVTMPDGTQMAVHSGPTYADGYTWWAVNGYVSGVFRVGWTVQDYLRK